jgi:hypothetical protein
MSKDGLVNFKLNSEQKARIELLSLVPGKSPLQCLLERAKLLLDRDGGGHGHGSAADSQHFLGDDELEARLEHLLRRDGSDGDGSAVSKAREESSLGLK